MKNILFIIGGLLAGYAFAYLSFKNKISPFKGDDEGARMGGVLTTMSGFTDDKAKIFNANYVAWAMHGDTTLRGKIPAGGKLSNAFIVNLLDKLNGNDAYYLFGSSQKFKGTFLMFTATTTGGTDESTNTSTETDEVDSPGGDDPAPGPITPPELPYPWVSPCFENDTCAMCPPVCPEIPWDPTWPLGPIGGGN